jgi:hypothetical protein
MKLMFGALHEKHAVQSGFGVPTLYFLKNRGNLRKTMYLTSLRSFR